MSESTHAVLLRIGYPDIRQTRTMATTMDADWALIDEKKKDATNMEQFIMATHVAHWIAATANAVAQ